MKRFVWLAFISAMISGCLYTDYAGIYFISRNSETLKKRSATANEIKNIECTVNKIAKEFGFKQDKKMAWESAESVSLSKRKEITTEYDHLNGSNAIISLYLDKKPGSISITIRDWENDHETEFMKSFKSKLEAGLSELLDMKEVKFQRTFPLT